PRTKQRLLLCDPDEDAGDVLSRGIGRRSAIVPVPAVVDPHQHDVAPVCAFARGEEPGIVTGPPPAREGFPVLARLRVEAGTVVHHHVTAVLTDDERRADAPRILALGRVGTLCNSFGRPVRVGELCPFPTIEQSRVVRITRVANAGPQLPGSVRRLPDGEVD